MQTALWTTPLTGLPEPWHTLHSTSALHQSPGMLSHNAALTLLAQLDTRLRRHVKQPASLHPHRAVATSFHTLGSRLCARPTSPTVLSALVTGVSTVLQALIDSFPDNIFWDFDYLAAHLLRKNNAVSMVQVADDIARLLRGFGQHSLIRFRYGHDFFYGYDWARWVRKDPEARQHVGPFDQAFLQYLQTRQGELLELITKNDCTYGQVPSGQYRNPFTFSRTPADEQRLHQALARQRLIPLEAWSFHPGLRWEFPYTEMREQYARQANIRKVA